jgi:hypothetical protein
LGCGAPGRLAAGRPASGTRSGGRARGASGGRTAVAFRCRPLSTIARAPRASGASAPRHRPLPCTDRGLSVSRCDRYLFQDAPWSSTPLRQRLDRTYACLFQDWGGSIAGGRSRDAADARDDHWDGCHPNYAAKRRRAARHTRADYGAGAAPQI